MVWLMEMNILLFFWIKFVCEDWVTMVIQHRCDLILMSGDSNSGSVPRFDLCILGSISFGEWICNIVHMLFTQFLSFVGVGNMRWPVIDPQSMVVLVEVKFKASQSEWVLHNASVDRWRWFPLPLPFSDISLICHYGSSYATILAAKIAPLT